jgi:hypothetical protein
VRNNVLHYLSRYTHRVAISNHRLVAMKEGQVSFRWKDYAHRGKQKVMTLSSDEFLRRFLLHVLPRGLVRIRHFGLFANRRRAASLARCRVLLNVARPTDPQANSSQLRCPLCSGPMLVTQRMSGLQILSPSAPNQLPQPGTLTAHDRHDQSATQRPPLQRSSQAGREVVPGPAPRARFHGCQSDLRQVECWLFEVHPHGAALCHPHPSASSRARTDPNPIALPPPLQRLPSNAPIKTAPEEHLRASPRACSRGSPDRVLSFIKTNVPRCVQTLAR